MSTVLDSNKIDGIGIDKRDSSRVTLQVIDPLNWEDEKEHLYLLQDKINKYLNFVESGEIYRVYPKAKNKNIIFHIDFLEKLTINGLKFLDGAIKLIQDAGYDLEYTIQDTIDTIQIEKKSRNIILNIDNVTLDVTEEKESLYRLQEKINSYLSFIATKEFSEVYPNSTTHHIIIKINFTHKEFSKNNIDFLEMVSDIIKKDGYMLVY